jgi:YegS/Rv2252/BmrU family lipid kinase
LANTNSDKLFFVINTNAGNEAVKKEWPKIEKLISKENLNYDFDFTSYTGHAEDITTEKLSEGYRKFIVVGGDGTLNEVINGIFKQKAVPANDVCIGLFGMGTGNDWAKYYQFPKDYSEAIKKIKECNTVTQDVGKIIYSSGKAKEAYFNNVAGLCYDAVVVKATNIMKERGRKSKLAYLYSLLKSLIKYRPWKLKIIISGEVLEGKFLSISIGNGKYSGGGMLQTPNAVINDGFLDVTIYPDMTKMKILVNIAKLYNGKILKVKGVRNFRTKAFTIKSENKIFAEIDGEIIKGNDFEFSVISNAINIIV